MLNEKQFIVCLISLVAFLYLMYNTYCRSARPPAARPREFFEPPARSPAPREGEGEGEAEDVIQFDLQKALDFSDITVTDEARQEFEQHQRNAQQIQTVDERFQAAKRKVLEHGMRPGMMPTKKRREIVEALVRMPACSRRTRSWRTQFSDTLRGDVVPKNRTNSAGIMRIGRSNPDKDLHSGALGQLSGIAGQWTATDSITDNVLDEYV